MLLLLMYLLLLTLLLLMLLLVVTPREPFTSSNLIQGSSYSFCQGARKKSMEITESFSLGYIRKTNTISYNLGSLLVLLL